MDLTRRLSPAALGLLLSLAACGRQKLFAAPDAEDAGTDATDATPTDGDAPVVLPAFDYQSGSRLRARILDGGGEARVFVGWHDSELDVDCDFRPVVAGAPGDDGRLRCMPRPTTNVETDNLFFLDSECTHPVRVDAPGQGTSKYVVGLSAPQSACASGRPPAKLALRGDKLQPSPARAYKLRGTSCGTAAGYSQGLDVFELGADAPVDVLVGATEQPEPRSDHLASRVLVAEDGARQTLGAYDRGHTTPCATNIAGLSPSRALCLPPLATARLDVYDAQCEGRIAEGSIAECPQPIVELAQDNVPGTCSSDTKLFGVGPLHVGEIAYSDPSNSCAPATRGSQRYYRQGAPLADGVFPTVTARPLGDGRVRRLCQTPDDGTAPLYCDALTDSTSGFCRLLKFCDGATRCVGADVYEEHNPDLFGDAACTKPVLAFERGACSPTLPTLVLEAVPAFETCQTDELLKPGARHDGPVYRAIVAAPGMNCVPAERKEIEYYDLEPAGSAETLFGAVVSRTE